MAKSTLSTRYIRIATKERPADRFLTVQVREAKPDGQNHGDLYFIVEIMNPWFPNSHVGQTVINTIVREYHRSESNSPLANFETALRKTNAVLAQITQNGETDWIGNLSSLILLHIGEHVYLAQTGRARGYLVRGGKISDVTEGLDEEANQHPLTTYTNITSGTAEPGDRLLLTSSQLPDSLSMGEMKQLLMTTELPLAGRDLIRALHKLRAKRTNAIILELNELETPGPSETLYLDQPLSSLQESFRQVYHRSLRPALARSAVLMTQHTQRLVRWSRDWLTPKLVDWAASTQKKIGTTRRKLAAYSRPLVAKTSRQFNQLLPERVIEKALTVTDDRDDPTLPYKVHHYEENLTTKNQLSPTKSTSWHIKNMLVMVRKLPGWSAVTNRWNWGSLTTPRNLLLFVALAAIATVGFSIAKRRTGQVTEIQNVAATQALTQAKSIRLSAERALALDQEEQAAELFEQAIAQAKAAAADNQLATEAQQEINAIQVHLDEIDNIIRLTPPAAALAMPGTPSHLALINRTIFVGDATNAKIYTQTSTASTELTPALSLPALLPATALAATTSDRWFFLSPNSALVINLQEGNGQVLAGAESWKDGVALAEYGENLYVLDDVANEIWKYSRGTDGGYGPAKAYLKEKVDLSQARDIAIDGEVYVLTPTSLTKYNKGATVPNWQLASFPARTQTSPTYRRLYLTETNSSLFILTDSTDGQSPRLIEFGKDGRYQGQLHLPNDWQVKLVDFDPNTRTGAALTTNGLYLFEWKQ